LNDNYDENIREDSYDTQKSFLIDILNTIQQTDIIKLWQTVISCGTKKQFIVLLTDGSHRCTCNLLITHEYPCQHFYKVLRSSSQARWHIGLVASRWYKDNK
ncbi:17105_t:CDS:1, partial [Racocetra fulgida]